MQQTIWLLNGTESNLHGTVTNITQTVSSEQRTGDRYQQTFRQRKVNLRINLHILTV